MWFLEHGLDLPVRRSNGNIVWRRPNYATIHRMIENPIYGGAYAYGKTGAAPGFESTVIRSGRHRKARDQWLALIPRAHEGYVSWERAEAVRKMVSDNVPSSRHHGAPKAGDALLSGLFAMPALRPELTVRYTGAKHSIPRYSCWRGLLGNGEPRCIAFGGLHVDDAIEAALFDVVAAAVAAKAEATNRRDKVRDALLRDLEAARYAKDRASRQYDAADPENRLVAAELEARWNKALSASARSRTRLQPTLRRHRNHHPCRRRTWQALANDLRAVWSASTTDARLKKRIVRTLIQEVIADIDDESSEIVLVIHWVGGVHTELRLPKRRRGTTQRHARHHRRSSPAIGPLSPMTI